MIWSISLDIFHYIYLNPWTTSLCFHVIWKRGSHNWTIRQTQKHLTILFMIKQKRLAIIRQIDHDSCLELYFRDIVLQNKIERAAGPLASGTLAFGILHLGT